MRAGIERHVLVKDSQGVAIVDTLPEPCRACEMAQTGLVEVTRSCGLPGKRRRGYQSSTHGSVFFCTNDPDLIESSRMFKRELEFYSDSLSRLEGLKVEIAKTEAHKTRRLLHNLISLNAHALQELYSVVPQDELGGLMGIKSQRDAVNRILRKNADACATLFVKALKNAAAVKTELAVFQKLYDPSPTLKFGSHEIHRVLLNVANYFFQDFADNQVRIAIASSEIRLSLDYESMQVALYHLLDNAAKYALFGSGLRISFSGEDGFRIHFEMTSLFVPEDERGRIYNDGFSGSQAKAVSKGGQGLGMGVVADLLKMNGARLDIVWGDPLPLAVGMSAASPRYAFNTLTIQFGPNSIAPNRRR